MGLLDDFSGFAATPQGQGLLTAAFAGLSGAGRLRPMNLLGATGMAGMQGYQQAIENQNTNSLKNIQLEQAKSAMERQKQILALQKQFATPAGGAAMGATAAQGNTPGGFDGQGNYTAPVNNIGPTNAAASVAPQARPSFDYGGYADALASIDPNAALAIKSSLQKETPFNKLDPKDYEPASVAAFAKSGNYADLRPRSKKEFAPNGQLVDVYSTPQGAAFSDPNKPFTVGANGEMVPNSPYQNFELLKAKAGATRNNVSVNTAQNPFFQGIGQFGAEQFKTSTANAQEAVKRIDQNKTVSDLLNSGKVYTGGGADWKLAIGKAAQAAGFNYDQDAVKNTELLGAQLANRTLNSIKSSGLGAGNGFTDADRKFLQEAVGGSITLNNSTLKRLVELDNKAALATIQRHNKMVKPVQEAAAMQGFPMEFGVNEPDVPAASAPQSSEIDALINKHRSR